MLKWSVAIEPNETSRNTKYKNRTLNKFKESTNNEAKILEKNFPSTTVEENRNFMSDSIQESLCIDSDSLLHREEIANFDDIIDCFTNKNFFLSEKEEEDNNHLQNGLKEISSSSPCNEDECSVVSSNRSSYKESSADSESQIFEIESNANDTESPNSTMINNAGIKTCELTFIEKPLLEELDEACLTQNFPTIVKQRLKMRHPRMSESSEGYESASSLLKSDGSSDLIKPNEEEGTSEEESSGKSDVRTIIEIFDSGRQKSSYPVSNWAKNINLEATDRNDQFKTEPSDKHESTLKEYGEDELSMSFLTDTESSSIGAESSYCFCDEIPSNVKDRNETRVAEPISINDGSCKKVSHFQNSATGIQTISNDRKNQFTFNESKSTDEVKEMCSDEECLGDWDDSFLTDTDEDEEIQEIMSFITNSGDEKWSYKCRKVSKSGQPVCYDCSDLSTNGSVKVKKIYGRSISPEDRLLVAEAPKSMAMYPIFDQDLKYSMPICGYNNLKKTKKTNLESLLPFLSKHNRSKSVDKYGMTDDADNSYRRRSKSSDEIENRIGRSFLKDFCYNSNSSIMKKIRTASSPMKRNEKSPKRNSHFFTEDFATNLPFTKSWLDKNIFQDIDTRTKFHRLFRSKSFSIPKDEKSKTKDTKTKPRPIISSPRLITKSLPKCKGKNNQRQSVVNYFKPKLKDKENPLQSQDFLLKEGMASAIRVSAEERDYLMWCPDAEFDCAVASLDMRGLVELVHTLQETMAIEQQTFESLSKQLEQVRDPLLQQRMSAALCTSQTRLARLCSRNMRCFTQQALKSRQKGGELDSRSSSPRDSGFAFSSSGSDFESDLKGPISSSASPQNGSGGSFKNSLAFFQKAASSIVSHSSSTNKNSKAAGTHRARETKRSPKKRSSLLQETSRSSLDNDISPSFNRDFIKDPETYEQVLFINGKPQYQEDSRTKRSHSYDDFLDSRSSNYDSQLSRLSSPCSTGTTIHITSDSPVNRSQRSSPSRSEQNRSRSYTRVQIGSNSNVESCNGRSVDLEIPQRPVRLKDSLHSKSLSDVTSCVVSLPRRKPVLNFGSVSDGLSDELNFSESEFEAKSSVPGYFAKESVGSSSSRGRSITRSHSFKEGLDYPLKKGTNLCRTQSCCDGLSYKETKLTKAPSVEEILESVKSLRAKKANMVKSNPDLLQSTDKNSHSPVNSVRQHKSSKTSTKSSTPSTKSSTTSTKSSTTSLVGVRYNGSIGTTETMNDSELHYYENIRNVSGNNQYEKIPVEVIYDHPKSTKKVEKRRNVDTSGKKLVDFYENINFDQQPLYENVGESEPTYMNITGKQSKRKSNPVDNVYANVEETTSNSNNNSTKSNKSSSRSSKSIADQHQTYDVPKSAKHIYDTPSKQTRQVVTKIDKDTDSNNYDTPRNNRSIIPQSSQILIKAKTEQIQKIDDIFADCEDDIILEEERRNNRPSIPPPDYGIEEDDLNLDSSRKNLSSPSTEYIDEGLGESDSRSYYPEDQGLEVILEEPEDDYSSSHSSEEDLRRRVDLQLRLKGKRRSLDGSEGIGSADSHSSGSEIGGEDDCASSGIHSEDTPSPGPSFDSSNNDYKKVEDKSLSRKEDDRTQQDRCVEVYPETLRQRQRNMAPSPNKVDIKNWETLSSNTDDDIDSKSNKKLLPSVKALRNQFESGKSSHRDVSPSTSPTGREVMSACMGSSNLGRTSSSSSTSSLVMSSLDVSSGFGSLTSSQATIESPPPRDPLDDEPVEPIFRQFQGVDQEFSQHLSKPPSTTSWDPLPLLRKLYYVPETPKLQSQKTNYINIKGYLEKLPSGRKKATFWNAWKRRFFEAKDGVLYYYQTEQADKPNMKLPLMGGKVEMMDPNMVSVDDGEKELRSASMLGIDDGKGHYVVVRCTTRQEAEKWKQALESHTADDFSGHYVHPWPKPTNPSLLRDTLVIDIGSCSIRAGVLASQPTLPQLFFPSIVSTNRETRQQVFGMEALSLESRTGSVLSFPVRPSHKISKFSVDLNAISSLLQKTFSDLKVDPRNYNLQLSVPRVLNPHTQAELLKILFDKYGVKSVNLTHQSILALYAYNATSGIVVDIGERLDVVPVTDGYIVDGGVSRVPYGGHRIMEHLRHFLFQRNLSLTNEVDSYIIRQVLETVCYCAQHYNTEKSRCAANPESFEKTVNLTDFFPDKPEFEAFRNIMLDYGRFQATEGLFNPDAWGLDHPGLHKLVHKAIQECSMDIRKEMSRSIFLVGGVSQLPGIGDRLTTELDNLTPPAIRPKVHASPYRYHASYLGACVLAESPAFEQSKITKEAWQKQGNSALRKWAL